MKTKKCPSTYKPSRREYFAAVALQALITKKPYKEMSKLDALEIQFSVASGAVGYADALMAELDSI
jgi:hypothetical protein